MAASGWLYSVAYQEDIEQAFQRLRQQVFEADNYLALWFMREVHDEVTFEASEADWQEEDSADEEISSAQFYQSPLVDVDGKEIDLSQFKEFPKRGNPPSSPEQLSELIGRVGVLSLPHFASQYEGIGISEEVLSRLFESQKPTREVVEAVVSHEALWPRIRAWVKLNLYCLMREPRQYTIFEFSEEVLQFLTRERSPQELIDALLAYEHMWMAIYPCLCSEVRDLVRRSVQGKMLPFPTKDLIRCFGTQKPTKEHFEAGMGAVWEAVYSGMGYYFVIYQKETPCEIVFLGMIRH